MKAILIPTQSYYIFLIIAQAMGWNIPQRKEIEVRKDFPKSSDWNKKVIIYCSKSVKSFKRIPKEYQPLMKRFLGKVIGEFVCDGFDEFQIKGATGVRFKRFSALAETCLSVKEMREYAGNKPKLYGWHISDLVIYDTPKELGEVKVKCGEQKHGECITTNCGYNEPYFHTCGEGGYKPLTRPPQSWCYVEGE